MSTTLNAPTYQSVNRMRSVLAIALWPLGAEHVPLAAKRAKQFPGAAFINLAAEALDVHLDQVGKRIKRVIPNVFCDFGPTHYPIYVAGQIVEQRVFLGSE